MFIAPFDGYFIATFVFGDKAVGQVMESDLPSCKMEGRIINITITQDTKNVDDILKLIEIKLNN